MTARICPADARIIEDGDAYKICLERTCKRNYHIFHDSCPLHPYTGMEVVNPSTARVVPSRPPIDSVRLKFTSTKAMGTFWPRRKAYFVVPLSIVVTLLAGRVIYEQYFKLEARLARRLAAGQLVLPVGDSAYDLWQKLRLSDPDSAALCEVATSALTLLQSKGEQVLKRWHDESKGSDQDWVEASRIYEWATLINPNENRFRARQSYSRGQIAFRQQKLDEAILAYNQALQYEKCMSIALNGIGRAYANKKDYSRSEQYYRQALQCEPGWCYPLANLGGVYYVTHRFNEAEACYRRAIECASSKASFHYFLAVLYNSTKRHCDALAEYQSAVNLSRDDPDPGFTTESARQAIRQLNGRCK